MQRITAKIPKRATKQKKLSDQLSVTRAQTTEVQLPDPGRLLLMYPDAGYLERHFYRKESKQA